MSNDYTLNKIISWLKDFIGYATQDWGMFEEQELKEELLDYGIREDGISFLIGLGKNYGFVKKELEAEE